MDKWIDNLIDRDPAKMWASFTVVHGGGELIRPIIDRCIWVRIKNGEWMPRAVLDNIEAHFKGANVILIKGGILLSGKNFGYRFRTFEKGRLTTNERK